MTEILWFGAQLGGIACLVWSVWHVEKEVARLKAETVVIHGKVWEVSWREWPRGGGFMSGVCRQRFSTEDEAIKFMADLRKHTTRQVADFELRLQHTQRREFVPQDVP